MVIRDLAVVLPLYLRGSRGEQVDVHRPVRSIALRRTDVAANIASDVRSWIAGVCRVAVRRRDVWRAELRCGRRLRRRLR